MAWPTHSRINTQLHQVSHRHHQRTSPTPHITLLHPSSRLYSSSSNSMYKIHPLPKFCPARNKFKLGCSKPHYKLPVITMSAANTRSIKRLRRPLPSTPLHNPALPPNRHRPSPPRGRNPSNSMIGRRLRATPLQAVVMLIRLLRLHLSRYPHDRHRGPRRPMLVLLHPASTTRALGSECNFFMILFLFWARQSIFLGSISIKACILAFPRFAVAHHGFCT
ncbi:hypothetical protein DFS34DRAFT_611571 [Phlyctochytrium arcticum]|nr:hypothetical protein DFS34DRAFT_611571 [Phlyctochytrium arcticum]